MRIMRLCAAAAIVLTLGLGKTAGAASTATLYPQLESGSGASQVFGLYLDNSLSVGITAVNIMVEGATGFSFATNTNISLADSVYVIYPQPEFPGDVLLINGDYIATPPTYFAIAPPGALTRLGAFMSGNLPNLNTGETVDAFAANFFGPNGYAIAGQVDYVQVPISGCSECAPLTGIRITVPEPALPAAAFSLAFLVHALGFRRLSRESESGRAGNPLGPGASTSVRWTP